jgi:hypothetical protein
MVQTINQCPLTGGNVVFKARSLLYLLNKIVYYNDRDKCNRQGVEIRNANIKKISSKVKLYPNPANESVTVEYEIDEACNKTLSLFNAYGQRIIEYLLAANRSNYIFNTSRLAPGIYSYKVTCNNNSIENGKLVIIH